MPSTRPSYGRLVGQLFVVLGDLNQAEDVVQEAFTRGGPLAPGARLRGTGGLGAPGRAERSLHRPTPRQAAATLARPARAAPGGPP